MLLSGTVEALLLLSLTAFVNIYLYMPRLRVLVNQLGALIHNDSMLMVAISN